MARLYGYDTVLLALWFITSVHAQATTLNPLPTSATCNITGINSAVQTSTPLANLKTPQNLEDLRTATPYTMTLSAIANGCENDPITQTWDPTMVVNGSSFPCTGPTTLTIRTQTLVLVSFTFPGLFVTSLTPGEALTMEQVDAGTTLTDV